MIPDITFGKCLKLLLTTLNISMNKLANAIHVDTSLVNRWVNEKRIPPQRSSYIEKIAAYLDTYVVNTYHIRLLEEMFTQLNTNHSLMEMTNKEKLYELLHSSLNYSRECLKKSSNECSDASIKKSSVPPNRSTFEISKTNNINGMDLSSNDKVIYGVSKIYSALIHLIETAITQKSKTNNIIYLTYYSNLDYSFFTETRIVFLRNVLLKAIDNGWHVVFLLRLDDNKEKLIGFIHFVLPVICTGKVKIYHLSSYDSSLTTKDMYIISGIGALSCYPSAQGSPINCAFYLKNKSAIDILSNYMNILLRDNAQSLIKYYLQDSNEDYHLTLSEAKNKAGTIYYYNWGFSVYLIPEQIYKKLLSKTTLTKELQRLSLNNYKMQLRGFIENIQKYPCNIICFSKLIEDLMHDHTLSLYTYSGVKIVTLEPIQIIEFLENIINFILSYDNLHVGFIFQDENHLRSNNTYHFFIKERKAVFLNIHDSSVTAPKVRLSMKESMIAKAFLEYFNLYWDQIAPINKDKREIIAWLQDCIDILKKIHS